MLKVVGLVENTTESPKLKCRHGLSLYIETEKHRILFDMGPNDLFLKNAKELGVDIASIDIAVISHGHVDHCGGLKSFLKANKTARIYLRPQALDGHYVKVLGLPFYAGMDKKLVSSISNGCVSGISNGCVSGVSNGCVFKDRFVFTEDCCIVDDEITLFSNDIRQFGLPKSDGNLLAKKDGRIVPDDFYHEQNLLISSDGSSDTKRILVCGCAHSGIVNIVNKAKEIAGAYPAVVVGGFHLYEPVSKRYEDSLYIDSVARSLEESEASYYTCHCTGSKAFDSMQARMGDHLAYLHTGTEILL